MKAGDYLFIQFGINDGDSTCDRHVGVDAFKTSYGVMAQAAKDRGAHPIFVTPLAMIRCSGTTVTASREPYVTATKDAGTQYGVPVIDLNGLRSRSTTARLLPDPGRRRQRDDHRAGRRLLLRRSHAPVVVGRARDRGPGRAGAARSEHRAGRVSE
jgi:lysophospholipase L1-like esterase